MKTINDPDIIIDRLSMVLGTPKITSNAETRFNCPFCYDKDGYSDHKYHLWVNIVKNAVHCFRCETRMSLSQFTSRIAGFRYVPDDFELPVASHIKDPIVKFPRGYVAHRNMEWAEFDDEVVYVKRRTHQNFTLFTPYLGFISRHVVFHNARKSPNHWWMRSIDDKQFFMPASEKPVYFLDRAKDSQTIVLAESPFGAIAWTFGSLVSGVALIGKSLTTFQLGQLYEFMSETNRRYELCVALDGDATDFIPVLCSKISSSLPLCDISFIQMGGVDADELTVDEIKAKFESRKDATLKNLLKLKMQQLNKLFPSR
jgi:hypothetical protein